jgi:hypothetical protein
MLQLTPSAPAAAAAAATGDTITAVNAANDASAIEWAQQRLLLCGALQRDLHANTGCTLSQ